MEADDVTVRSDVPIFILNWTTLHLLISHVLVDDAKDLGLRTIYANSGIRMKLPSGQDFVTIGRLIAINCTVFIILIIVSRIEGVADAPIEELLFIVHRVDVSHMHAILTTVTMTLLPLLLSNDIVRPRTINIIHSHVVFAFEAAISAPSRRLSSLYVSNGVRAAS